MIFEFRPKRAHIAEERKSMTRKQAEEMWDALCYEEPVSENEKKRSPATSILRFLDISTSIYYADDPNRTKIAAFLREVADALERPEP